MAKFSAAFGVICVGLLWALETTLACNCEVKHPQTQFKEADFVVKAKILNKYRSQEEQSSYGVSFLEYEVKISKIFKGRRILDSNIVSIFTPEGHSCGIRSMKPGRNYLISGRQADGRFSLDVCSWVEEWSTLTKEQKKGLKSKYGRYCRKCNVPSVSGPELVMALQAPTLVKPPRKLYSISGLWVSEAGSCTFNPVDSWLLPTIKDCETQFTYCAGDSAEQCGWEINNKYKDCFVDRETAWAKREIRRTTVEGRAGVRLGNIYFGCSPDTEEFDVCIRHEIEIIVTRFL